MSLPGWLRSALRAEYVLPLGALVAAAVLAASEFMDVFALAPPRGDTFDVQTAAERHGYGLLLLALFAVVATIAAVTTGSRPAAIAVAVAGGVALLVFATIDLPDVNDIGSFEDQAVAVADARAEPRAGFWLELVGALGLILTGWGMALMREDQLRSAARALDARRRERRRRAWPRRDEPERLRREEKGGRARRLGQRVRRRDQR